MKKYTLTEEEYCFIRKQMDEELDEEEEEIQEDEYINLGDLLQQQEDNSLTEEDFLQQIQDSLFERQITGRSLYGLISNK
jgi:hypothetical protein